MGEIDFRDGLFEEALPWYLKSAKQKYVPAALKVLDLVAYEEASAELSISHEWAEELASQEDPLSMLLLAKLLKEGIEQMKDSSLAEKYAIQAALQGLGDASYFLFRICLEQGREEEATGWLELALYQGSIKAEEEIAESINQEER